MSTPIFDVAEVDALATLVLAACGGGRVAVYGLRARHIVRRLRRDAVDAVVRSMDDLGGDEPFDLIWVDGALDALDADAQAACAARLRALVPRALVMQATGDRDTWVRLFLRHDWRRHPQHQGVTGYAGLEGDGRACVLLFEPLPADAVLARDLHALAATRDLHMDMLREAGRRADAHIARYTWARQFVRPGDRVLDAACGLGYGSAVLADATLCAVVVGMDGDAWAVDYARQHYGAARPRLTFETRDLATLADGTAGSFDVIVSFETIEHLEDPAQFVRACRQLLTPGGRLLCSVPNAWVDEHGVDPNPYHLHVFDRARLEALCAPFLTVEHVYGQTAGGGMKLGDRPRALWHADASSGDAEWWLLVGMRDPLIRSAATSPAAAPDLGDAAGHLLAFGRDYEYPGLVRAMVAIGQRSDSPAVLTALAVRTRAQASAGSADEGAALCVQAYRALDVEEVPAKLLDAIDAYCSRPAANPHVHRWHISLRYVQGLLCLVTGERGRAIEALGQCASIDPLVFNPLLATKTVAASSWLGWMAAQARDWAGARRWWQHGVEVAERALHRPWSEMVVDRDTPVLFGLREATEIVDLASRCATGLHFLPHAAERPGLLASQWSSTHARRQETPPALSRPTARFAHVRRVVVFGTGAAGRAALTLASRCGWAVDCLVDNNPGMWSRTAHDHIVRSPVALAARDYDLVIVASQAGQSAIFSQLETLGLVHRQHFIHFLEPVVVDGLRIQVSLA